MRFDKTMRIAAAIVAFFATAVVCIFLILFSTTVKAAGVNDPYGKSAPGKTPITTVRNVYSSTNVTTSAWVEIVSSLSGSVNMLEIFDSSGKVLKIGTGDSGSEVEQFKVIPGGNGQVPVYFPQGTRIAIKAVSADATAGELDINFYQ